MEDDDLAYGYGVQSGLERALSIAEGHRDAPGKSAAERMQASWIAEDIRYVIENWPYDDEPPSGIKDQANC